MIGSVIILSIIIGIAWWVMEIRKAAAINTEDCQKAECEYLVYIIDHGIEV